jgi:hypothetical protein
MCTECSVTYILNVAGGCVTTCPVKEFGVVGADYRCTGERSTTSTKANDRLSIITHIILERELRMLTSEAVMSCCKITIREHCKVVMGAYLVCQCLRMTFN